MPLPTQKTPKKQSLSDLTITLYGRPKIGKSTWCSRSPKALILAAEQGLNSLEVYQVSIPKWETFLGACKEIQAGKHGFKTIGSDRSASGQTAA